jgi:hypothetical protein
MMALGIFIANVFIVTALSLEIVGLKRRLAALEARMGEEGGSP